MSDEVYNQFTRSLVVGGLFFLVLTTFLWRSGWGIRNNLLRITALFLFFQAPLVMGLMAFQALGILKLPELSNIHPYALFGISMLLLTLGFSIRYERKRKKLAAWSIAIVILNVAAIFGLWSFDKIRFGMLSGPALMAYLMFLEYLVLFAWSQLESAHWSRFPANSRYLHRFFWYAAMFIIICAVPVECYLLSLADPLSFCTLGAIIALLLSYVVSCAFRVTS